MQNFRASREKLRKTNVKLKFPILYFLNLNFLLLNVGLNNNNIRQRKRRLGQALGGACPRKKR